MNRYIVLSLATTWMLLIGCEQDIDVEITPEAPRLVVYGVLNPDSLVSVWISQTKAATDPSRANPVTNATVLLSKNDQPAEPLLLYDAERGHYRATFRPEVNATYRLRVRAEGFPAAEATTHTVAPVPIQDVAYEPVSTGLPPDCYEGTCTDVYQRYRIAVTWTDPANQENYYGIDGLSYDQQASCRDDTVSEVCIPYVRQRESSLRFFSNDPVLGGFRAPNEAIYGGLRFADQLFSGETYTFGYEVETIGTNPDRIGVVLSTFHPDIYYYERSKDDQEGRGLGEPGQIYQNIVGGYGIFSSYSQDTVVIELD